MHHAYPCDNTAGRNGGLIEFVSGGGGKFEELGPGIDELLNALPGRQLALLP